MPTLNFIKRWLFGVILVLGLSPLLGVVYTYTRGGESTRVYAANSSTLNFQARLMASNGALVADGSYSVEFNLYTATSGGSNEWTATQAVSVKNGYFSTQLGAAPSPFSGSIDWSQEKWLTMNINGDGEMTPRIKLTAVPYAFRSGQADSLTTTGGSITGDNLLQKSPGSVQSLSSSNAALRLNQTGVGGLVQLQGDSSDVFTVDKAGNTALSGRLQIGDGLTLGNSASTTAGTMRWTGTDFEGFDGLSWLSLTTGGGLTGTNPIINKTKTADETVNNSTTFQDDDQLFFSIGANETWTYRYVVQANSGTAPDFKFAVTAPAGATCKVAYSDPEGATSVANLGCGVSTGMIAGNATAATYEIMGTITNGSTAGPVRLQWAQNTLTASNTIVHAGSYVTAIRAAGGSDSSATFIHTGNSLGEDAVFGTNDNYALKFITNGINTATLSAAGDFDIISGGLQTAGTTRITNSGGLQNVTANTDILTSGILGFDRGGTGATSFTTNGIVFGGASALQSTGAGIGGQLLIAGVGGVPSFMTLSGDATLSDSGGLTITGGAISNTKLANSSFSVSYGSNLSGDASVVLGGTLNLAMSAAPSFTSVSAGTLNATNAVAAATTVNTINGLIINSGALSGITGFGQASGAFSLTGTGTITVGGGSNALSIDSTAFDVNTSGAVSGVTSLGLSGSITGATTNTINGLNISGGSVSGVTGLTFTSGNLVLGGGSITGAGSIAGSSLGVTGAISAATATDTINGLIINAGALSGVTSISASGTITANTTGSINGLNIASGSLSGITGFGQASGAFSLSGVGAITLGAGNNALSIDSTAFDVSNTGALSGITSLSMSGSITAATSSTINGLNINSGSLSGVTGFTQASGNFAVSGSGTIGIGGGSNVLTIDSTNFDVSSGAITMNGTITAATSSTVNGLSVNSGALSSVTGFTQGSGNFAMSGAGTFETATGAVGLNGATTISTSTNSATALTVNGTTGTAADALRIAQTGNAANLVMTNTARTTGALFSLTQTTSTFSGTGLLLNFAAGSGTFTGDFLDFQLNGSSKFRVDSNGGLTINSGSTTALAINSTATTAFSVIGTSGGLLTVTSTGIQVGTSDTTALLFRLDTKTSSGDPTATAADNGSMYYNSSDKRFRCYEDNSWKDCIVSKAEVQLADQSVTNSAAFANAANLVFPVEANSTYTFTASINFSASSATSDFKYTFTVPTGSVVSIQSAAPTAAAASTTCNITASGQTCTLASTANFRGTMDITGYVKTAGTAGNTQFQFAQNTAVLGQSATIYGGSSVNWKRTLP